ncbi:hypothetical protein [Aeromicrobium sp.]|uniref:hypothetical protein n=1 Tax=Aeromicrobium sp. TaxID=1871063 RepID=UPI0019C64DBD|nr:hypothetical protein [Aeromicrobium sp.]MBC7630319.1 hypothetical protein [Aeromicrobium sp.]
MAKTISPKLAALRESARISNIEGARWRSYFYGTEAQALSRAAIDAVDAEQETLYTNKRLRWIDPERTEESRVLCEMHNDLAQYINRGLEEGTEPRP